MAIRPIGNPIIPYDTPLHVMELFLQILKLTFEELPEDYPYRYVRDDFDKSGVAFDVALNKDSEVYGKKPLVVVSRGMQGAGPPSSATWPTSICRHISKPARTSSRAPSISR